MDSIAISHVRKAKLNSDIKVTETVSILRLVSLFLSNWIEGKVQQLTSN